MGLSPTDRLLLTGTVNMIFHGAATVRFDENIKTAVGINTRGVQAMLTLAREMEHLKVSKIIPNYDLKVSLFLNRNFVEQ